MGHELKNNCKEQAEALTNDTSDNPEQPVKPPIALSKRPGTRALREVQYYDDDGGYTWQVRGGNRRHQLEHRLPSHARLGSLRGGPADPHDARVHCLHKQRAAHREHQENPEQPRTRHSDENCGEKLEEPWEPDDGEIPAVNMSVTHRVCHEEMMYKLRIRSDALYNQLRNRMNLS